MSARKLSKVYLGAFCLLPELIQLIIISTHDSENKQKVLLRHNKMCFESLICLNKKFTEKCSAVCHKLFNLITINLVAISRKIITLTLF